MFDLGCWIACPELVEGFSEKLRETAKARRREGNAKKTQDSARRRARFWDGSAMPIPLAEAQPQRAGRRIAARRRKRQTGNFKPLNHPHWGGSYGRSSQAEP